MAAFINISGKPEGLHRETIAAAAGAAGVRVVEVEAFAVQSVGEVEFGACQVEEAFHVHYYFDALVFKLLVHWLYFIIEVEVVGEAGATAPGYRSAQTEVVVQI